MTLFRSVLPVVAILSLGTVSCGGAEGAAGPADASGATGGLIGSAAPDFTAEAVTGDGPKSLQEAKGKVVILDFWATFCEPCKKSFPKYQELVDQFHGELVVIAVSVDDPDNAKKEDLVKFAKDTGVKFGIVWDKDHQAVKKYDPKKMPTSFVIDKSGTVKFMHGGYETGEEAKIAEEVKGLLK